MSITITRRPIRLVIHGYGHYACSTDDLMALLTTYADADTEHLRDVIHDACGVSFPAHLNRIDLLVIIGDMHRPVSGFEWD